MIAAENFGFLSAQELTMMLVGYKTKEFPPFTIHKGNLIRKKIKYSNKEQYQLNLSFESQDPEILKIKNADISLPPHSSELIHLRIFVPAQDKNTTKLIKVNVIENASKQTYEQLTFTLNLE